MHDIGTFDRFARYYDFVMPSPDVAQLEVGLGVATGAVERIVDLGGGTGRAANRLDPPGIVVDAAPGMVETARDHGLEVVLGTAEHLPIGSDALDAIVIVDALHHFEDASRAIDAAYTALRPGGVLVVREFDPRTIRGRLLTWVEHLVGFQSQFFAADTMHSMLRSVGFDAEVLQGGFGYTVVGLKPEPERTSSGRIQ